eukprot:gnl/MRDRNA2_/MRDRNA2_88810_c0_seq1.p1 gnl/MRDRNA2_/MRDRNA2_88810_c0~~gnl/MRDRNA2_/MRDRNA2_88810_c0_seq1.p1  ORF type:complete len:286 (+),score=125.37 gnl/MRDRNA2_/MRDRNA2_88810_c0_seq1:92-949(+)
MSLSTVLLLLSLAPAVAVFRGSGAAKMQPEVVSKLLSDVEKKWTQSRVMVLRNVTDEDTSYASMEASCLKVSSAVVAGSEGDKDRVVEYMQDVCAASPAKDAPTATMCTDFASGIEKVMTDDESWNRDSLDLKPFCKKFWSNTVSAAAQVVKQKLDEEEAKKEEEEKKREEEEKQKKEEEAKRAEEEAAAAKKAAEEQAAAEAARKEAEQQKNATKPEVNATAVEAQAKEVEEPAVAAPQVTVNATTVVETDVKNTTEAQNTEAKNVTEAPVAPASNTTAVAVKK